MAFLDFNLRPEPATIGKWLFLKLLSSVYKVLIRCWLFLYHSGIRKPHTASKTLISVGNITLGGTGKTPMIDWLLRFFEDRNLKTTVLTRGYKAERVADIEILNQRTAALGDSRRFGDEPWMLYKRHPETAFLIGPDRVKSSGLTEDDTDLILLDDGMQHLRLDRNLNLVLIDSLAGIGNGNLFPLGPLREPLNSLNRADAIVYTRTNLASPKPIQKKIRPYLSKPIPEFEARYQPRKIVSSKHAHSIPASKISGKSCLLFSGIGNPASFVITVQQLGGQVIDNLIFGDHASYHHSELKKLTSFLLEKEADFAICTEKDWVKLENDKGQLPEFWYLQMEFSVDGAFAEFIALQSKATGKNQQPD